MRTNVAKTVFRVVSPLYAVLLRDLEAVLRYVTIVAFRFYLLTYMHIGKASSDMRCSSCSTTTATAIYRPTLLLDLPHNLI